MKKIYYRDLTKWQRKAVCTLRKNPRATIIVHRRAGISTVLKYLRQQGHSPRPNRNRLLEYYTNRTIDDLNHSNVMISRLVKGTSWHQKTPYTEQ